MPTMTQVCLSVILLGSALPFGAFAETSATASTSAEARIVIIEQYLHAAGCPRENASCDTLAATLSTEASSSAAIIGAASGPSASEVRAAAPTPPPIVATPELHAIVPKTQANPVRQNIPVADTGLRAPRQPLLPTPYSAPPPAEASAGNELLRRLPTLFVLDALFARDPSGILAEGPATLGNLIILYQIFFASHLFSAL